MPDTFHHKFDISNVLVQYGLHKEENYAIEEVDPRVLLCPKRLDIAAKYLYLCLQEKHRSHAEDLYNEHIRCMTKGAFIEPYSDKKSAKDFIRQFDDLYAKMQAEGYGDNFSPIPVDKNYRIMDGAHRVAVCLKLGIRVPIVLLPIEAKYDVYDQHYFESLGMSKAMLNEIVFCYLKLSAKCVCINVWPSAKGHESEFETILNREFDVVYRKDFELNENGAFYYLAQIYKEYSWAQNNGNQFSGIYRKLLPCFPQFQPVRAIFAEVEDRERLIAIKEEMRTLFGIGKHSLHITDNEEETIQMGNIILSDNTILFLNHCQPLKFKNTFKLLEEARILMERNTVCITGSLILSLYGIRAANDVDYISEDDKDKDSHNEYLPLYELSKEDVLYLRENQFYFFDITFLTLTYIKRFKKNRNESKDNDDIKLIDFVLLNKSETWNARFIRIRRRAIANIQGIIIRMAHSTGTYEMLRKFYKTIK